MDSIKTIAQPVARLLAGLLFLIAGLGKTQAAAGVAGYMESVGIPGGLVWPVILFEIGAGLLLIIGYQTRIVAFLLAGFCVLSGVLFHFDLADQNQVNSLLKNIALAGGYLMFFVYGAGAYSVDGRARGTIGSGALAR